MNYIKIIASIIFLILIIKIIAFFSGSETAYLSISKIKMRSLVKEKKRNAGIAAKLHSDMDGLLTVVLIGTNFMNTLASALAASAAVSIAGNKGVGISAAAVTFFSSIFGQIIPKTAAALNPEDTACRNSYLLFLLKKLFFPAVRIFSKTSNAAYRIACKIWKTQNPLVTEEELKFLIDLGEKEGILEEDESRMLYKIFKLGDLSVHNIMRHRFFIKSVPFASSRSEIIKIFNESGVSILPVYSDSKELIIGIVHYKSVLLTPERSNYISSVMHEAVFVPESFSVPDLISLFKKEHTEFAIALDEQGETAGLVTMDDIMQVIFGRMTNGENSEIPPEERIKVISTNEFIVPGGIKIEDLNNILRLNLESEEFSTAGGWLLEQFGRLPSSGEVFTWNDTLFIVEDQAQRRILSIRIKLNILGSAI